MGRSDSKNPNTTCRGITSSGRPCRRGITATTTTPISASLLPGSHRRPRPQTPDPRDESLYCWQHREQASLSAHSSPGPRATATPILEEHRTSLDTLADRLGLVDLQEKEKKGHRKGRPVQQGQGQGHYNDGGKQTRPSRPTKQKKPKLQCCFCFSIPLEQVSSEPAPARPQPRPVQRPQTASMPVPAAGGPRKSTNARLSAAASPSKSSRKSTASHTARLKDLIPDTLDAGTASALMAELARPYVDSEEAGYIYMFWLTPTATASTRSRQGAPPVDAARDLLASPSPTPRSRRPSDVVYSYADRPSGKANGTHANKTMVLKIGRAANVQRRMNQWQRQCGRDVEVLRFYPYLPSMAAASSSSSTLVPPRTTPHAHRVERLIHIELAGMGLKADKGTCDACGREHREWFEVDATRASVREVDGVIRRWVEWDEGSV